MYVAVVSRSFWFSHFHEVVSQVPKFFKARALVSVEKTAT